MESNAQIHIRSIGDEVAYCDTAEERILEIMNRVSDPTDGSDLLAAEINDWPTRYHCSPQRSNILRPFKINPGTTVLEIGAGTGALTRYLAEQGAVVTAVEGTRTRAESLALRCRGMKSVEVICGDFKNFESTDTFDIVLVVGVLEYAASAAGGQSTPSSFLDKIVALLAPQGVVILAIENQVGLKYLLGGKEDHLGKPWVGIEDYPGNDGVKTWGRHTLNTMLSGCGLVNQRWFFPFPDYKTPSSILSEAAYDVGAARNLIDQWTSPPIVDHSDPDRPIHDDRAVHGVFLSEGLGPDVANSFLVTATKPSGDPDAIVDPNTVLWNFGGDRRRDCRRLTMVTKVGDDSLWVQSRAVSPTSDSDSWLKFHPDRDHPYIEGPNLEQEILGACRRGSSDEVEEILDDWWNHLVALEKPVEGALDRTHPYLSTSTTTIMDPVYLDVQPSNFVRTHNGMAFIDREWEASPAVDATMVRFRALWYMARTLIVSGAPLPWPDETTVESMVGQWMERWTVRPGTEMFTALYQAEAALQLEVSGGNPEAIESALAVHGQLSRKDVLGGQNLGHSKSPDLSSRDLVPILQAAISDATLYQRSLENQIADQKARAVRAEQSFQDAAREAAEHQRSLEIQITDQKTRADRAEQSFQDAAREATQHQRSLEIQITDQKTRAELAEKHFLAAQATISEFERDLGEAGLHIQNVEQTLNAVRETVTDLQGTIRSKDLEISELTNDIETIEITLDQTRVRLAEAESWRRDFERHLLVRFYRRLRWWLPQ